MKFQYVTVISMYDLQQYMAHLAKGLVSNKKLYEIEYGKSKSMKIRSLQRVKLEAPLFQLHEDDLP